MKELKIMKEIKCDYVVTLYGEYMNKGYIHLALEYMDKGTLSKLLQLSHKIPENILKIITKQIVLGVYHLHSDKHIIHRDMKPSNILINSDGFVKISDFGVSSECMNSIDARRTFTGTMLYMSPERLQGLDYKFDSDIWSLGIIILECSLGYFPIPPQRKEPEVKSPTFWELTNFYKKMNQETFKEFECSSELNNFIKKCLQIDPKNRSKASELLKDPFINDVNEVKGQEHIKSWLSSIIKKS